MYRLASQAFRTTRQRQHPAFQATRVRLALGKRQGLVLYSNVGGVGTFPAASRLWRAQLASENSAFSSSVRLAWHEFLGTNSQRVQQAKHKWQHFEANLIAVVNGVSLSTTGPKLLGLLLPPVVTGYLYPYRFTCLAHDATPTPTFASSAPAAFLRPPPPPSPLAALASATLSTLRNELLLALRAAYLLLLFLPALLTAPAALYYLPDRRPQWLDLMTWTLQNAGPAFIKWGQWAATRPDLFPQDLCTCLERLQTGAPTHTAAYSRAAIAAAFARPVDRIFDEFDDEPVASGSIAQIHRAVLSRAGAAGTRYRPGTVVAVKVRHPGVTTLMERDFTLMSRAAELVSRLPALAGIRLEESVAQFGAPLREQLNLKMEAEHLSRFNHNFRLWSSVSFPRPIYPLVEADVLVETFEEGDLISRYVKQPGYKHNEKIAETGMQLYLQMLLKDNFIHADLHPGNILVKEVDPKSWLGLLSRFFDVQPQLILLDTGMIAELSKTDQLSLQSLFRALTKQDGERVARSILSMAEQDDRKDHSAFVADMKDLFDRLDPETIRKYTSDVLREMIETVRQHQVTLRGCVSTVVVTTLVLEGWSSKLHPDIRILDSIKDMLAADWSERISLAVDKIMASNSLALT